MPRGSKDWHIYIGNIPHLLTKEDIEGLFKKYNIVEAGDIHYNGTKTFCFMKLRREDDVTNAVTEMNNHNVNGRKLQVRRFENKQQNAKQEKNDDTKSHCSSLTFEDVPPLLETQFGSESNSDSSSDKNSWAHYSSDRFQASGYSRQNSSNSHLISGASPLPPGFNGHNTTRSSFHMSPQGKNSSFSNNHNQLNETSDFSPIKRHTPQSSSHQHSQFSPQGENTKLRSAGQRMQPLSPNKSASQQSDRSPQFSANCDHSLQELPPERYRYVHCTRNVISYNPRDLENNKMRLNLSEHSSAEAVKVWAANFPYGTSKTQMSKLFEDFSPLNVCIINNAPGQDFTRATITLPSLDIAEAAIMELDNTIYKRRTLLVGMVEEGDDGYFDEEDYDEEEDYGDDGNYYYYEPYGDYSEQDYCHRPQNDGQLYYEEPISRRLHNTHLS